MPQEILFASRADLSRKPLHLKRTLKIYAWEAIFLNGWTEPGTVVVVAEDFPSACRQAAELYCSRSEDSKRFTELKRTFQDTPYIIRTAKEGYAYAVDGE